MQDYRKLKVWQKSHQLTLLVYRVSAAFPRGEGAVLRSQIRRAAVSVSASIAEGCGRQGARDLARYLQVSLAAVTQVEYHALLARDLGFVSGVEHERVASRVTQVRAMLSALGRRVRQRAGEETPSGPPGRRVARRYARTPDHAETRRPGHEVTGH